MHNALLDALASTAPDYTRFEPGRYWIFLGYEKSGKTSAASTFSPTGSDGVLIFDLESGVRSDKKISIDITSANTPFRYDKNNEPVPVPPIERGFKRAGVPTASYSMIEALNMLEESWATSGKTTLVVDTLDKLSDWCNQIAFEEIIEEDSRSKSPKYTNATCPEDIPYAAAFVKGRVKVLGVINRILDIIQENGILILITHLKKATTITESREMIIKRVPKLPEQLANVIGHGAESIAMFDVDAAGKHFVDFRPYSEVLMGSRIKPLNGRRFEWFEEGPNTLHNVLLKAMSKSVTKQTS